MLLYIHIPFCDSKCHYCAFNSYTDKFNLKQDYMQALLKQLNDNLKHIKKDEKIESVFIGGGTPSTVKASLYEDVFKLIKPYLIKNCEVTTEANPNSATFKWLEQMKSLGVNRVSFGVQSFNDEKLKKLGRSHNSKRAIKAIQEANCIGFNGINCDIIYGVIKDDFDLIKKDFDTILKLPINHLSAYSLTLEKNTKFYEQKYMKIDDEELSYKIFEYLNTKGFTQYEISNFSKDETSYSKHNFGYWEHKEYLGIGAGAVGYVNKKRYYPNKSIEAYIQNPLEYEEEILSDYDIKVEKVLLGFRCKKGVDLSLFDENELKKVDELVKYEKLELINTKVYNKNFLLADELALYILE